MEPESETKQELPIDNIVNSGYELDYVRIVLFLFIMIGIGLLFSLLTSDAIATPIVAEESVEVAVDEEPKYNPFDDLILDGQAAFVFDVREGKELYAKNEEMQLPLASITKLMTILAASSYIEEDETITISYDSLKEEGDSGLIAFEEWNAKDLFDFTLIVSSNDGADALASVAGGAKLIRSGADGDTAQSSFIDEMNRIAKEIGLKQTFFVNETGLDPTTQLSGAYGSARDTSLLLEYIILQEPHLIEATVYPILDFVSTSNYEHIATNTNEVIGSIPGLIASKTGFTDLAGGNLVIAFDAGIDRPVIVSVLGSSKEGRFTDVEKLVTATLEYINN